MPIIGTTGLGDVPTTVRAIRAGAVDFRTKPFSESALPSAMTDTIERSRVAIDREADRREMRRRYHSLSTRGREVMMRVVAGLLNKQVGKELQAVAVTAWWGGERRQR